MVADLDIARWRLGSQHLVWPYAVSAAQAVGSLLAVQAENPSQAAWAVASRTQNPDQAELAALLDDGAVVRTHVLRSTWHFVRAEDAGWLLDLTGPRVRRVTGQQLRNAHGLDERSIGHAVTAVAEALASREHLIRDNTDRLRRIWSLVRLLTCDFWSGWPEPAASSSRTERAVQRNHCYLVSPLVTRIA